MAANDSQSGKMSEHRGASTSSKVITCKRDAIVGGFVHDAGRQTAAARRGNYLGEVEEEDINEVADAFIKRFRKDLHLQRLRSIENYNQMLARGL
ncbi:hypothetical protein Cni_G04508 [Canna indica]|uniref:Uncharacterized protein n=1 Tax=Canna indica TaxID=4628 RepID=A0AAQ3JW29_9LILI|nr:hypothetical protein Cni_G04508 [Canna indica]